MQNCPAHSSGSRINLSALEYLRSRETSLLQRESAGEKLYGYSSTEIIGQTITWLFADSRELERLYQQRASGKKDHFDTIHIVRNGAALSIRIEFVPLNCPYQSKTIGLLCSKR